MEYGTAAELEQQARRTAIDHLRVTLSRATETLVFVDVAPGDRERALSLELLGDAAPYDPEDLVDHFAHAEASPEERVLARTNDARVLIDSAPGRAWQRARQAIRLLGDPGPAERRLGPGRAAGRPDDADGDRGPPPGRRPARRGVAEGGVSGGDWTPWPSGSSPRVTGGPHPAVVPAPAAGTMSDGSPAGSASRTGRTRRC